MSVHAHTECTNTLLYQWRGHATEEQRRIKVENMATAMHCNMRPSDDVPVLICFNYDVHTMFEVAKLSTAELLRFHYLT